MRTIILVIDLYGKNLDMQSSLLIMWFLFFYQSRNTLVTIVPNYEQYKYREKSELTGHFKPTFDTFLDSIQDLRKLRTILI
jgi:hypothetical protein